VVITIKNVPKGMAVQLKARAKGNHRSMQGEAMSILESALTLRPKMAVEDIVARVRARGLRSPSESAKIVREMRDAR